MIAVSISHSCLRGGSVYTHLYRPANGSSRPKNVCGDRVVHDRGVLGMVLGLKTVKINNSRYPISIRDL
jgi:hypothetical protein